jgi:hypothetical protein
VKGRNGHLISGTTSIVPEGVEEEYRYSVTIASIPRYETGTFRIRSKSGKHLSVTVGTEFHTHI